ncbi:MAG: hypothetical protein IT233_08705 [Bacteroidia bacterium]|nr:hypothetical protein [Bacteroidia bacterium]
MKKLIFPLLGSALAFLLVAAKDVCDNMLFFTEGVTSTMTSYNENGKLTGSVKSTFTKVGKITGGTSVTVHSENFDKKGKSTHTGDYTITCKSGLLYFDMKAMIPQQNQNAGTDMEMVLDGVDMEYPASLEVGASLKDANIKVTYKMKSNGSPVPMMNIEVRVFNRKVEAKESITTPAGTYECYKISEDVETQTIFKIKAKSVNWFSYKVGTVRTESYKDNGKMMGYSELTEFKK